MGENRRFPRLRRLLKTDSKAKVRISISSSRSLSSVISAFAAYSNVLDMRDNQARITKTHQVLTGIDDLLASALDTETGERLERKGVTHEAQGCATFVVDDQTYMLPLADVIDFDAERARLKKAVEAIEKERDSLAKRLDNPAFVEKAKPEAVEKARADHAEKAAEASRLRSAMELLG